MLFSKTSTEKCQLGIYWGKDAFCFTESTKGQSDKVAYARFDMPIAGDQGQKIPDSIRFTALLQQIIRDKKFTCKKITLTLSAKDIIYRSFVIPFMQPAEVKNVVDFEATKYIPIKLEDLAYTYHAVAFSEGEQKNLRILFVAVRKNILERYTGILQQAGLETEFIEPSSVSLIRILQKQGHVPRQHATGIIEVASDGGRITITDKDVIQFVREFQSTVEGSGTPAENAKLFHDIRVSLNFYQRQNPQGKIDRIAILSEKDLTSLAAGLEQEFKIPASSLTIQKILKNDQTNDPGILCACGASLRDRVISSKNFDLTLKSRTGISGLEQTSGTLADWNFKLLGASVAFFVCATLGLLTLTTNSISENKKKSVLLKQQLGIYESSTKDAITGLKEEAIKTLEQHKNVRIKSDLSAHLKKIPHLLTQGAWLDDLSFSYYEKNKIAVSMDGSIYLLNTNDQIRQINTMVAKMKNDKNFAVLFDNIILSNVRKDTLDNYPITHFRITCK